MGQKLSDMDATKFAPSAKFKEKGQTLKGVLMGSREIKTMYGPKVVYSFKVEDASCLFIRDKQEIKPVKGDTVETIPPTRLAVQLGKAKAGDLLLITYLGLGKKVGANAPHTFDVEVL